MKKRVRIGGIRTNPGIDKINAVEKGHIREMAVGRMEQLTGIHKSEDPGQYEDTELGEIMCKKIPLVFDWEE